MGVNHCFYLYLFLRSHTITATITPYPYNRLIQFVVWVFEDKVFCGKYIKFHENTEHLNSSYIARNTNGVRLNGYWTLEKHLSAVALYYRIQHWNISINNFVYVCHIVVINVRSDPPNKCKRPHEVCINKNWGFECRCETRCAHQMWYLLFFCLQISSANNFSVVGVTCVWV
jgi:hypothetical protein